MEKVSWKHSKAYHTISFSFSPEGRFLILDRKTGSREAWRKPCGCHLERAGLGWAPHLAPLPSPSPPPPPAPSAPALQPALHSPLVQSNQKGFVLLLFRNTQTKDYFPASILCASGAHAGGPPHGFCMGRMWGALPFHIWAIVAFSYPWQEIHQSCTAIVPISPSQIWPMQTTISSCLSDLSLPACHSPPPSQAPRPPLSPHVLSTVGQQPQHSTKGDRSSRVHSQWSPFAVTFGLRDGMLHHSRTANLCPCVRK